MRRGSIPLAAALCALALGCHREVEMLPLVERTIYVTDKFYDVQAVSKDRAFIVGYGGKILETSNGGASWDVRPSGTEHALYAIAMVDDKSGWIVGQEGLVLHTADGGKSWQTQESNATFKDNDGTSKRAYLFALDALDANTAMAVGDRSTLTMTKDGGKTWTAKKVPMELDTSGGETLAAADPIFYAVDFTDAQHGWIVGEFGKIMYTEDGGDTWREQERSLMEGTGIFDLLDLPTLFGISATRDGQRAIASGLDAHVAATTDRGARWTFDKIDAGNVPLLDPLYDVTELPDGTGWGVGAAGEVIRKGPADPAWTRAKIGQDVLTWLRAIHFSDPQNGWIVGGFGLIFRTTDGGKTWLPSQG
jgi:photosystem II stability/assembly factor-like uncharacterized protein